MVKKIQKSDSATSSATSSAKSSATASATHLAGTVKESAQQIWLAGLGAFSKAQDEGGKVFDSLVKEGMNIQRKTQSVAEEKITEATQRMSSMANEFSSKATGQWDKLENIFEGRVAKALSSLGVPSAKEVAALKARIDELETSSGKAPAKSRSPARKVTKPVAKKVAVARKKA